MSESWLPTPHNLPPPAASWVIWCARQMRYALGKFPLIPPSARESWRAWFLHLIVNRRRITKQVLYNDVFSWMKINGTLNEPRVVFTTDKEFLRTYVRGTVGEQHNVPIHAILKSAAEIRAYNFPATCFIKPTHGSGEVILRRDGEPVDITRITKWLDYDHYAGSGEVNYRHLERKIVVEPPVFGKPDTTDYKIYCAVGKARIIRVNVDRYTDRKTGAFDLNWNNLGYKQERGTSDGPIPRPGNLDEILALAETLARDFFIVRIDLYSDGKDILVGEITHCVNSGGTVFYPPEAELLATRILFEGIPPEKWDKFFG